METRREVEEKRETMRQMTKTQSSILSLSLLINTVYTLSPLYVAEKREAKRGEERRRERLTNDDIVEDEIFSNPGENF